MSVPADPLRRLAEERGRTMGELGVRPEDGSWVRADADAIASLTAPDLRLRVAPALARILRRLARAVR